MRVTRIKLNDFRNYAALDLSGLGPGVVIVRGANAQGKTNLLEAIHICANGKSFRVQSDATAIRHSQKNAYIMVEFESGGKANTIEALLGRDRKKSIKLNGIPLGSIKELMGALGVVVFSPEDIRMARESPALRRAFLDGEISKIRPSYIDALKNYAAIVAQKNAILRKHTGHEEKRDILMAFNYRLAGYIKVILKNRMSYVKKLEGYAQKTQAGISGGGEDISISYRATIREDNIEERLSGLIPREIEDMMCMYGPHRDDMEIKICGRDVKNYASQGQMRTLMLSLKLACHSILHESSGHVPVMLLDDVFAELDDLRKANLLACLSGVQAFITTADESFTPKLPQNTVIEVKSGEARIIE